MAKFDIMTGITLNTIGPVTDRTPIASRTYEVRVMYRLNGVDGEFAYDMYAHSETERDAIAQCLASPTLGPAIVLSASARQV